MRHASKQMEITTLVYVEDTCIYYLFYERVKRSVKSFKSGVFCKVFISLRFIGDFLHGYKDTTILIKYSRMF